MSGASHALLLAAGSVKIDLQASTVSDAQASPTTATGSIATNRDGTVTHTGNASSSDYDYATPKHSQVGDAYEIKLDVDSGDAPTSGDSTGVWLALTSNRSWTWSVAGPGSKSASCTLRIRQGGVEIDNAAVTVAVESS